MRRIAPVITSALFSVPTAGQLLEAGRATIFILMILLDKNQSTAELVLELLENPAGRDNPSACEK